MVTWNPRYFHKQYKHFPQDSEVRVWRFRAKSAHRNVVHCFTKPMPLTEAKERMLAIFPRERTIYILE
jgi:hypothetical protein